MTDHIHEEDEPVDSEGEGLDTRARLGRSLEGILSPEALDALLTDVLAIKKQARGWSKTCSKAVYVEVSDAKAVVGATSELMTPGLGRPGSEPEAEAQTIVRIYYITGGDGPEVVILNGEVVDDPRESARLVAEAGGR